MNHKYGCDNNHLNYITHRSTDDILVRQQQCYGSRLAVLTFSNRSVFLLWECVGRAVFPCCYSLCGFVTLMRTKVNNKPGCSHRCYLNKYVQILSKEDKLHCIKTSHLDTLCSLRRSLDANDAPVNHGRDKLSASRIIAARMPIKCCETEGLDHRTCTNSHWPLIQWFCPTLLMWVTLIDGARCWLSAVNDLVTDLCSPAGSLEHVIEVMSAFIQQ